MEFAQEQKERRIAEDDLIVQLGIYTREQTEKLIVQRNELIDKINSQNRTTHDYLNFIVFEKKFLDSVEESDVSDRAETQILVKSITNRIIILFRSCLEKFPNDFRVLQSFIKFVEHKKPDMLISVYEKWLKYHGDNIVLWGDAALWAYSREELGLDKAFDILMRAIDRHPSEPVLYKLLFDMIIFQAASLGVERNLDVNNKRQLNIFLQKAELIVVQSMEKIKDIENFISALKRCELTTIYEISMSIQHKVCMHLFRTFGTDERLWDFLARRELRGCSLVDIFKHMPLPKDEEFGKGSVVRRLYDELLKEEEMWQLANRDEEQPKPVTLNKKRIKLCCTLLQVVLLTLKFKKSCCIYIEIVMEIHQQGETLQKFKRKILAEAFKLCHQSGVMCDSDYYKFFRFLVRSNTGLQLAAQILDNVPKIQNISGFYEMLINTYIKKADTENVKKVLGKATERLDAKSHKVWRLALQYFKTRCDFCPINIMSLYKTAAKTPHENFLPFRVDYLDFYIISKGLDKAYEEYNTLARLQPPCYKMHEQMLIWIQTNTFGKKSEETVKRLRAIHTNMVEQFGSTNVEVWIEFLKFEQRHGDVKNMPALVTRARNTLNGPLLQHFETAYALLQCEEDLSDLN